MKKLIYIIPVLAFMLFSCENYLDINDDPNNVGINQVPPRLLLPGAQLHSFKVQDNDMKRLGNVFMNSWAGNVYSFTGGFASEYNLTISNTFYDDIFEDIYLNVANFQVIIDYPNDGSQDNYVAIAKIMKAYYMQYIVDLYGDAPYTEAFKLTANPTPSYNDDAFIYEQLYNELNQAEALIASGNGISVGAEDIMMQGDMSKWSNFAKIVKLKLLMRMSTSTDPAVIAFSNTIVTDLAGTSFDTSDITLNPGYSAANDDAMNPFVLNYRIDSAGNAPQNYSFIRPSKHIADFLNGTGTLIPGTNPNSRNYPTFNDPRAGRLWTGGASGGVVGNEQGETSSDPTTFPNANSLGILNFWPYYNLDPITIDNIAAVDSYVMTKQQIELLLAETSLVYPTIVPTAAGQTHFNNGVKASFDYLFISAGYTSYASNIASVPGLGWTGSNDDKLEAIMTQKWLGLVNINPIESYIDYTRTGYPATPLATSTTKPNKPKRLIYPASEYIANSANVPNVTEADVFVVNSLSPFWLQ